MLVLQFASDTVTAFSWAVDLRSFPGLLLQLWNKVPPELKAHPDVLLDTIDSNKPEQPVAPVRIHSFKKMTSLQQCLKVASRLLTAKLYP